MKPAMARGTGVLCMSRWLQCFLGPQAFLTALGECPRFVARYITINGNKEGKWWLKRWELRVGIELLSDFYGTMSGPCHLFYAAYENRVGWEWDFMASGWHKGNFEGKSTLVASISPLYNTIYHNWWMDIYRRYTVYSECTWQYKGM